LLGFINEEEEEEEEAFIEFIKVIQQSSRWD